MDLRWPSSLLLAFMPQFLTVNKHVGDMLDKLPALADQSNSFLAAAPAIAQKRNVNLQILKACAF